MTRPLDFSLYSDPEREWQAHLFHIPSSADEEIEEWCAQHLDRRLLGRPPELEVMTPPVMTRSLEGILTLREGSEVILSVKNGTWWEPLIELHDFSKRQSQEYSLAEHTQFCSLGQLRPGRYGAYFLDRLDLDCFASLQFEIITDGTISIPSVILVEGEPGIALRSTDLLDSTASSRWAEILTGRSFLHEVRLPPNWHLSLQWKSEKGSEDVRNRLDESTFLTAFSECLRSRPVYVRLEAGLFGSVEWYMAPKSKFVAKKLPPALTNRLRWLRSILLTTSSDRFGPLGIEIPKNAWERLSAVERELVAEFAATRTWPVIILPQARSVALELTHYLQPVEEECLPRE
jgi:hypothetical protein